MVKPAGFMRSMLKYLWNKLIYDEILSKSRKYKADMDVTIKFILLVLSVVISPFILIILEKMLLPYPVFVEEIVKVLVIFFLILNLPEIKYKIMAGLLFGFLFGLSENIFYLTNIIDSGEIIYFWQRMILVTPMHITTTLIILLPALKSKWFIIFGLAGAIALHTLFNGIVAN